MLRSIAFILIAQSGSGSAPNSPINQDRLIDALMGNPVIAWTVAGFAVLALVTTAIAEWTGNLGKIIEFVRKYAPGKSEVTDEQRQRIRRQLISLQQTTVAQRLRNSLHELIKIDLEREEQRQRVGNPSVRLIDPDPEAQSRLSNPINWINRTWQPLTQAEPDAPVAVSDPTLELFDRTDINGRLLILGEPGSGKTTELLNLAKDLLERATEAEQVIIPVIFELSSWNPDQSIAEWLCAQLHERPYRIAPAITQHWIATNQLLPLLDGLDELGLTNQISAIGAINTFLADYPLIQTVVCCRREEYEKGNAQLTQLNGAIYLQPITDSQIEKYLQDLNRARLWPRIASTPELLELARSPLFLTILVVAYQGQPIHTVADLFDAYIEKQLHDPNNQDTYPPGKAPTPGQTRYHLSWLAYQLEQKSETEFLIERLQPTWLPKKRRQLYRSLYQLICGSIFGLAVGMFFAVGGLIPALISGLTSILLFRLFSMTGVGLTDPIFLYEKLNFNSKTLIYSLLFWGIISGLSGWVDSKINGLILGLTAGLILGLTLGLITGFDRFDQGVKGKVKPNGGIWLSIQSGIISGLIVWLISGIIFGLILYLSIKDANSTLLRNLIVGLIPGMFFGIIPGVLCGLNSGLETGVKHYVLRVLLYHYGYILWNYKQFLDHAAQHRFIQPVGGRYRFMHDLLRKHFAAMYQV